MRVAYRDFQGAPQGITLPDHILDHIYSMAYSTAFDWCGPSLRGSINEVVRKDIVTIIKACDFKKHHNAGHYKNHTLVSMVESELLKYARRKAKRAMGSLRSDAVVFVPGEAWSDDGRSMVNGVIMDSESEAPILFSCSHNKRSWVVENADSIEALKILEDNAFGLADIPLDEIDRRFGLSQFWDNFSGEP